MPSFRLISLIVLIAFSTYVLYPLGDIMAFFEKIKAGNLSFFKYKTPTFNSIDTIYLYMKALLIGPILEKVLYRKIIFSKIKENHSTMFALLFSSFLFALVHLDLENFLQFFLIGILYGYVYYKTDSVICSILFHSLVNLFIGLTTDFVVSVGEFYYIYTLAYIFCALGLMYGLKNISASAID
ncbi:lysostaphin resistance A-like protein [Maribacter sp. 2307ULW6-5]|uniref:CPBP family intramembrane glutamic endopeptidase n=1 Tax=Maribacter sp. 2307ULW6-5 TaxID=3386275 RepID=UPI0039BD5A10